MEKDGDGRLVDARSFVEWLRGELTPRRDALVAEAWRAIAARVAADAGDDFSPRSNLSPSPATLQLDAIAASLVVPRETRDEDLASFRALWGRSFDFDRQLEAEAGSVYANTLRESEDAAVRILFFFLSAYFL